MGFSFCTMRVRIVALLSLSTIPDRGKQIGSTRHTLLGTLSWRDGGHRIGLINHEVSISI